MIPPWESFPGHAAPSTVSAHQRLLWSQQKDDGPPSPAEAALQLQQDKLIGGTTSRNRRGSGGDDGGSTRASSSASGDPPPGPAAFRPHSSELGPVAELLGAAPEFGGGVPGHPQHPFLSTQKMLEAERDYARHPDKYAERPTYGGPRDKVQEYLELPEPLAFSSGGFGGQPPPGSLAWDPKEERLLSAFHRLTAERSRLATTLLRSQVHLQREAEGHQKARNEAQRLEFEAKRLQVLLQEQKDKVEVQRKLIRQNTDKQYKDIRRQKTIEERKEKERLAKEKERESKMSELMAEIATDMFVCRPSLRSSVTIIAQETAEAAKEKFLASLAAARASQVTSPSGSGGSRSPSRLSLGARRVSRSQTSILEESDAGGDDGTATQGLERVEEKSASGETVSRQPSKERIGEQENAKSSSREPISRTGSKILGE